VIAAVSPRGHETSSWPTLMGSSRPAGIGRRLHEVEQAPRCGGGDGKRRTTSATRPELQYSPVSVYRHLGRNGQARAAMGAFANLPSYAGRRVGAGHMSNTIRLSAEVLSSTARTHSRLIACHGYRITLV